jgi:hypothetical protein
MRELAPDLLSFRRTGYCCCPHPLLRPCVAGLRRECLTALFLLQSRGHGRSACSHSICLAFGLALQYSSTTPAPCHRIRGFPISRSHGLPPVWIMARRPSVLVALRASRIGRTQVPCGSHASPAPKRRGPHSRASRYLGGGPGLFRRCSRTASTPYGAVGIDTRELASIRRSISRLAKLSNTRFPRFSSRPPCKKQKARRRRRALVFWLGD